MIGGRGLVSLLDMIRFKGELFNRVAVVLAGITGVNMGVRRSEPMAENVLLSPETRVAQKKQLSAFADTLYEAGLTMSLRGLFRTLAVLDESTSTYRDFDSSVTDLADRLHDELAEALLWQVAKENNRFLATDLFGFEAKGQFVDAQPDIAEAGKCLAFGRSTAAVFHLMRVTEVGLKALAKPLGIPYAPSWENYLRQINERVQLKQKKKGIQWKRDESLFKEIAGDLLSVKTAWRNTTMHIERQYTGEEAQEIFAAVRTFMQRLATRFAA